jgi:hypothetical protein
VPAIPWTTRYEDLRRRAHEEGGGTDGAWGLALFLRQGMRAWMQAWPAPVTAEAADPSPAIQVVSPISPSMLPSSSGALPADLTRQLVPVLAHMILARPGRLQEVCL